MQGETKNKGGKLHAVIGNLSSGLKLKSRQAFTLVVQQSRADRE